MGKRRGRHQLRGQMKSSCSGMKIIIQKTQVCNYLNILEKGESELILVGEGRTQTLQQCCLTDGARLLEVLRSQPLNSLWDSGCGWTRRRGFGKAPDSRTGEEPAGKLHLAPTPTPPDPSWFTVGRSWGQSVSCNSWLDAVRDKWSDRKTISSSGLVHTTLAFDSGSLQVNLNHCSLTATLCRISHLLWSSRRGRHYITQLIFVPRCSGWRHCLS